MSLQVETLEKNMAKLTISVPAEDLDAAMQKVYLSARGRIAIPGFRKGKAPRKMIERMYGAAVFLEDAVNSLVPDHYNKALAECDLKIVSQPKLDVVQMEPGKDLIFTAEVAVKPEVTLGEYKGLEVPRADLAVTEEEVDTKIRSEQEKNGRTVTVEDRPAQKDDIVTLDFAGTIDGAAFDGGTASDHRLTLGSGSFIPGFEDQLIGAKTGDHVDVTVTFPETYHEESLAGKEAVFACDIKKIEETELPDLDDEFAQDVSDCDTMEEYRASVRKELEEQKAAAAKTAKEDAAVRKAVENAEMEIPDAMIEAQAEQMVEDFARNMQSQGLTMDQYFQYTGQTKTQMVESYKPMALDRIKTSLLLEKVAETEQFEVTEADIDAELEKIAGSYGMELDKIKELYSEDALESLKREISIQKAVDLIGDTAVETDVQPEN